MFTNCNCCYINNCYMPNNPPYIQMQNLNPFSIFFILQYGYQGSIVTKKSLVFASPKKERLNFPASAQNINFNVLRATRPNPTFLFNGSLPHAVTTCFEILTTPSGIKCIQVPC